jgi:hypothetical protein
MRERFVKKTFRQLVLWEVVIGKTMLGLLLTVMGLSLRAQEPGFHLEGVASRSLPVTGRKMTNVIFPVDIAAGVRVSREVLVQKVRGIENVIELKALKRDFAPTNLAVYGKDGRLYSFVLHYVEDTTVLDYRVVRDGVTGEPKVRLDGWPVEPERLRTDARMLAKRRGFLHRRAVADGLRLELKGAYLCDSLLWLSLELRDRTAMGFPAGSLRVYKEDRKRVKRTATQDLDIAPVYSEGIGVLLVRSRQATALAFRPFVVGRGKRLVIEVSDREGDRQVVLRVKGKTLMRAMKVG